MNIIALRMLAPRFFFLFIAVACLCNCGWQLRGSVRDITNTPSGVLKALHIVSENRNNAFYRELSNVLKKRDIQQTAETDIHVMLGKESLRRQPLTYSRSGIPAQYQLILSVEYSVTKQSDDHALIEEQRIVTRRSYDFDPDLIIAKDREEEELLTEMRSELAERIIASILRAK